MIYLARLFYIKNDKWYNLLNVLGLTIGITFSLFLIFYITDELNYDRFLFEYDSPRAGGFEPLRFLPKGKVIVLGLVSTKVAALDSVDEIKRRIDLAAKHVPLEQIAISPQCGFSSDVVGNLISPDDQK